MGSKNDFNGPINTSLGLSSFNHHQDQEKEHRRIKKRHDDHLLPSLALSLSPEDHTDRAEVKMERASSMSMSMCSRAISDQEDEEGSPRKKLRLSKGQSAILEDNFKQHSTLNHMQKQVLAARLNMRPRQVEVWFQNRRARTKLKQTEEHCEILKKWWETLTEENKKLHNELKALKLTTSSMCICCHERNGGSTDPTSDHHLFNPLTHPSAAC